MGCFDTVHFRCPRCGATIEVQSKAGDCLLREYQWDAVPVSIAADLHGTSVTCPDCGVKLRPQWPRNVPTYVSMKLEVAPNDNDD